MRSWAPGVGLRARSSQGAQQPSLCGRGAGAVQPGHAPLPAPCQPLWTASLAPLGSRAGDRRCRRRGAVVAAAYGQQGTSYSRPGAQGPSPYGPSTYGAPPQQQRSAPSQQHQQQPAQSQPPQQQQGPGTHLASADGAGTALKTKDQPKMVQTRFWLKFHVDYGQSIRIIGGHEAMGAWNLAKAPFLRWSDGDLWNVSLDLVAGGVYEYKYVVVEGDGTVAASWQRGANNVLALQMNDSEVEVYDNWWVGLDLDALGKNAPGSLVVVDGEEITRERKLLAWASDMAVQRSELRRTRMELAQAREEIRVLRAELSVLRMEVSEANIARAAAEARQMELERENKTLRLDLTSSNATARSTMEEAARLLNELEDDASGFDTSGRTSAAYEPVNTTASASSSGHSSGGGDEGERGRNFFGFRMPGGNGKAASSDAGPGSAASAVVAAAAAMAAAADARRHSGEPGRGSSGTYSQQRGSGSSTYAPPGQPLPSPSGKQHP